MIPKKFLTTDDFRISEECIFFSLVNGEVHKFIFDGIFTSQGKIDKQNKTIHIKKLNDISVISFEEVWARSFFPTCLEKYKDKLVYVGGLTFIIKYKDRYLLKKIFKRYYFLDTLSYARSKYPPKYVQELYKKILKNLKDIYDI